MRQLLYLFSIIGLLLAALGATSVPFVFADCSDGDGDDNVIECTSDPGDGDVLGDEGNDTITVSTDADPNLYVAGDDAEDGGDDVIIITGDAVVDDVVGDDAEFAGDDVITVNGDADYVVGDYSYFCYTEDHAGSCNDTITVNGSAYEIIGDDVFWCLENDCNDTITVGENGSVGAITGDEAFICTTNSCNDTIVVNGSAEIVIGDNSDFGEEAFALDDEGLGFGSSDSTHNDNITINGEAAVVVGDNVSFSELPFGESSGGYSGQDGNDTITVNGFAGIVVGDSMNDICSWCVDTASYSSYGNSGNDVITVSSTGTAWVIIGDSVNPSTCFSGCVSSGSSASNNDSITVDGTVMGDVFGDSLDGYFSPAVAGLESSGGGSFTTNSDTITITGVVGGDVFADSDFGKGLLGVEAGVYSSDSIQDDTVILPSGGVQYIKKCGDINATLVGSSTPSASIGGTIYGGDWETHGDTLFIGLTTADSGDIAALQAQLDAAGESGSVTVGGHTYNWNDFENVQVQGTVYSEGATQLFDNGVVSAYMGSDGKSIDVCYNPEGYGYKVSLVNFEQLDQGVREFSLGKEGFTAIVNNDTSTCDAKYTPAGANWKVELYQNGVMVDNHFCFIH